MTEAKRCTDLNRQARLQEALLIQMQRQVKDLLQA